MKPVKVSLRPYAPELKNLSNGALGAHARALAWSCMNETDGELTPADVKATGATPAQLEELFSKSAWNRTEDGRVFIHNTGDNPSRAQMQARRDASLKRVRRHRDREDTTDDVTPPVTPLQQALHTPLQPALHAPLPSPAPPPDLDSGSGSSPEGLSSLQRSDPKDLVGSARDSETRAKVREVFECWKVEHRHPRAILDRKRDARVRARLGEGFTPDQLCQAIRNAKKDEFLMGKNDDGKKYDDLESLLKSASKVERLLELGSAKPVNGNARPYHEPFKLEESEAGLAPAESLAAIAKAKAAVLGRTMP